MAKFSCIGEMNYKKFSKLVRNLGRDFETETRYVDVFRKLRGDPDTQNAFVFGRVKVIYDHEMGSYPQILIVNQVSGVVKNVNYDVFYDDPERFIDLADNNVGKAIEKFLQGVRGEGTLEEKKDLVALALEESGETLNLGQWGQKRFSFSCVKAADGKILYQDAGAWYIKEELPAEFIEVAYLALFE